MSYMTDILNSMSMNVSSGYEILSFRMYWKQDKKIVFFHFYCSALCTFASVRNGASLQDCLSKGLWRYRGQWWKEATKGSHKQLCSTEYRQVIDRQALLNLQETKVPRESKKNLCFWSVSEMGRGLQFSPWEILAGTAQTPHTHHTRTWQCRRTWSDCSNQSSVAGMWGWWGARMRSCGREKWEHSFKRKAILWLEWWYKNTHWTKSPRKINDSIKRTGFTHGRFFNTFIFFLFVQFFF